MKHFILSLMVTVFAIGFGLPEAEAKRLGSGSSIGMQRQTTPQQPATAPQQNLSGQKQTTTVVPAQTQPKRNWLGPIAGLAAGLGLAALFSHLGLGEELASFVLIALLLLGALLVFRMLFRRAPVQQRGLQYATAGTHAHIPSTSPAVPGTASGSHLPAGFDVDAFARQAKVNFIRLQAANDAGNLDDIREFTSPEMFAEIKMQLGERGNTAQQTDVVELNAQVLDVVEEAQRYIVSVRFNGLIREARDMPAAPFDEIWHLTKSVNGKAGWVVAGIQQLN